MRHPSITFATTNPHKRLELHGFLNAMGGSIEILLPETLDDVAETGGTFFENALIKAEAACDHSSTDWVLAEDSGLVIPSLAGRYGFNPFPGVFSNRWMTPEICAELLGVDVTDAPVSAEDKNAGILRLMENCADRRAEYHCALVLLDKKRGPIFQALGVMPLRVALAPAGEGGFGYDPIMYPVVDGEVLSETVASFPMEVKNRLSHRGKALTQLLQFLESQRVS